MTYHEAYKEMLGKMKPTERVVLMTMCLALTREYAKGVACFLLLDIIYNSGGPEAWPCLGGLPVKERVGGLCGEILGQVNNYYTITKNADEARRAFEAARTYSAEVGAYFIVRHDFPIACDRQSISRLEANLDAGGGISPAGVRPALQGD
jgi:hypothetical protein